MNTPVHPQIQRTLAAIVVTDAVSFSWHMSQDEDKALAMINRDLQLISELCEFFEGKILKTVGDGVLMYFISAIQAAACAVEMQKTFAHFAKQGRADEHFTHRVGVHLGDIFFNQQDMMGTGVNIAARLEAAAPPGAICMSQVVYDVVKSRLPLDAIYAGDLSLKNIEETIAAYHVWPLGMRSQESPEETTKAIAPISVTPITVALSRLSSHPNGRRIKKLLYGACKSVWENDASVLESIPLKMLLESLTNRNASLQDCRHSLYQIVGTLNRQHEYTQVAETILKSLEPFYKNLTNGQAEDCLEGQSPANIEAQCIERDQDSEPDGDPTGGSILLENPMEALYQDVASQLDQTSDIVRIKKMLYCLCYDRWENDGDRITAIPTVTLVTELYRQITTLQSLQNRLRAILLRLNRKAKYAPIANKIFDECQILYPEGDSSISMPGTLEVEDLTGDNTQINVLKATKTSWMPDKPPDRLTDNPIDKPIDSPIASTQPSMLMRSVAFGS